MNALISSLILKCEDYNKLINQAKDHIKEVDVKALTIALQTMNKENEGEVLADLQSRIHEINETSEYEFNKGEDKEALRHIKSKIQTLANALISFNQKKGGEDLPIKNSPQHEAMAIKTGNFLAAKYAITGDLEADMLLDNIMSSSRKSAFVLAPAGVSDESHHFNLHFINEGKIEERSLTVDQNGRCTLSDENQQQVYANFEEMSEKMALGPCAIDLKELVSKEEEILLQYGCYKFLDEKRKFGKRPEALVVASNEAPKPELMKALIASGAELDSKTLNRCLTFLLKLDNGNDFSTLSVEEMECVQILIGHAAKIGISTLKKEIDEAADLTKRIFNHYLDSKEMRELKFSDNIIKARVRSFSSAVEDILEIAHKEISAEALIKNPEEYKRKIFSEFIEVYLEDIFDAQDLLMRKNINRDHFAHKRLEENRSSFLAIQKSYINQRKELIIKPENLSFSSFEAILIKEVEAARQDTAIFLELTSPDRTKRLSPPIAEQMKKGDKLEDYIDKFYLGTGVCMGASLWLASRKVYGQLESTSQPSEKSRFYQAAAQIERSLEAPLRKKLEELGKEYVRTDRAFLIEPLQKKLGIKVKSIEMNLTIHNFITQIESVISKLDLNESSHFIIEMELPKTEGELHDKHAIYCNLSSPYEIQDVNRPGYVLKTEDFEQFKQNLFLYFMCEAPLDFTKIKRIYQITKAPPKNSK